MYASINQWSFGPGLTPADCLKTAAEQGFGGYEPALSQSGPLSLEGYEKDARQLKAMASDLGIRLPSLASGLYWDFPYTSDDANVRQQAIDITKRQIDCAKELGVASILVVPGAVGTGFFGTGATYRDAYQRAQEALATLAPYAQQAGIIIGVENVWNNFLITPMEMATFVDQVGSAYVKCYFDVGNVLLVGESADWIDTLGDRITCIHVKDFRRAVGTLAGFVPLLEGDVDWPAVMAALGRIGFTGALTAEINPVKLDPRFAAGQALAAIRRILALAA